MKKKRIESEKADLKLNTAFYDKSGEKQDLEQVVINSNISLESSKYNDKDNEDM